MRPGENGYKIVTKKSIDFSNFLCYNLITVKRGENYYGKFLF